MEVGKVGDRLCKEKRKEIMKIDMLEDLREMICLFLSFFLSTYIYLYKNSNFLYSFCQSYKIVISEVVSQNCSSSSSSSSSSSAPPPSLSSALRLGPLQSTTPKLPPLWLLQRSPRKRNIIMNGSHELIKRGKGGFRTHIPTNQKLELFPIKVVGKIVQEVGFDCLYFKGRRGGREEESEFVCVWGGR